MTSLLDRLEAELAEGSAHWELLMEKDTLAVLLRVARAAEELLKDDELRRDWSDCVCSYCVRCRELMDALAALGVSGHE